MNQRLVSVVIVTKDRKKDLEECVKSYLNSSYKNVEIIIIDNASNPAVFTWFPKNPKVRVITSEFNLGAAGGRNNGFKASKGDYIIFTDDDASAEKDMIKYLVSVFQLQPLAGLVQPLVYDKEKKSLLQSAGHDINLTTGQLRPMGVRELDHGQYDGLREVPMCGCVWMVKREVFEKIGNYDEDYFIPYEDSDFSVRAGKAGFKVYCYSKAKSWHRGIKKTFINPQLEWLGVTTKERAFRLMRNKMIFMAKNSLFPNNLFFFFVLLPFYSIAHSIIIILSFKFDMLGQYWTGVFSGLKYCLFRKDRNIIPQDINTIDKSPGFNRGGGHPLIYHPFIIKMIPEDLSGKIILDLGCGKGIYGYLIRATKNCEESTLIGVEGNSTLVNFLHKFNIYDRVLKSILPEIRYKGKADYILCSEVIEHLPKNDGVELLNKIDKICRKMVIITTPNVMFQPAGIDRLDKHLTLWSKEEFQSRGYKVYGIGIKLPPPGAETNVIWGSIFYGLEYLFTPISWIFPRIGGNLIAVKYFN